MDGTSNHKMTEKTNEEFLNDKVNEEPENSLHESFPAKESNPNNTNQEKETMEVQKHPHHVTHSKKWGEYLLEFFMLFLAVFLGFVAENIREHIVENDRAKEYAVSLVQDLQKDTAAINIQIKTGEIYISITDSLLNISNSLLEGRNAAKFSFYTRFMYWTAPLSWNRATFEQIKNSGGLRYFKNYLLLEKLMKYNGLVNEIEGEFNNHRTRGNMLLNQINEIIDPNIHHELSKHMLLELDTMSNQTIENLFSIKTESLENKRKEIRELLNMTIVQQRNLRFNNDRLLHTKELASELIGDLQKEYGVE